MSLELAELLLSVANLAIIVTLLIYVVILYMKSK